MSTHLDVNSYYSISLLKVRGLGATLFVGFDRDPYITNNIIRLHNDLYSSTVVQADMGHVGYFGTDLDVRTT